ncbi:MAG: sensor histidine kinase [Candidatus Omnitrophica bacterium]|nr:sensor histidine kinase [Candidatus Omnitrophota bacterium]
MKRAIDWRLAGGFASLLFLIVAIGLIGIFQIQSLSRTVDELGRRHFPMQKAALEMRVKNSLYARGIRNYIFWRSARYLEAARGAADREGINAAVEAFERQMDSYSSFVRSSEQRQWVAGISALQQELRAIGEGIINLVDRMENTSNGSIRKKLESSLNKLMMEFESKLYRIDDFLEGSLQKANLEAVRGQLLKADSARKRAILLLRWSLIFGLLIGGETAWFVYRNRRQDRKRREELMRKIIKVEEEEREKLSLQVHDQMGQDLSGLRIYLDLIDKKLPLEREEVKKDIGESKRILSGLIERSHNIAELLRPPALDEVGLVGTIDSLILQYRQMSGIKFTYQKPGKEIKLSSEYSLLLYRVTQEGLTNVLKHSQAAKVKVALEKRADAVCLSIADDGVGFNYGQYLRRPYRREEDKLKLGLAGLRERVELLGGRMAVATAPGKGTRLLVQLPIAKT